MIQRALLLCEFLIRLCESKGLSIDSSKEHSATIIAINGDPVPISLSEKSRRIELSPEEQKKRWRKNDFVPSGKLSIEVLDPPYGSHIRSVWTEGKRRKLEDMLPEFVDALPAHSEAIKNRRLDVELQERKRHEEERKRGELSMRIRAEKEKRDQLLAFTSEWHNAAVVRAFCSQVEQKALEQPDAFPPEMVARWLQWARKVADKWDPLLSDAVASACRNASNLDDTLDCTRDAFGWPLR